MVAIMATKVGAGCLITRGSTIRMVLIILPFLLVEDKAGNTRDIETVTCCDRYDG